MLTPSALVLVLLSALAFVPGCSPTQSGPGAKMATDSDGRPLFTYAPQVGRRFRHRMKRYEQLAIIGAPMRQSEEWIADWDVEIRQESNRYIQYAKLVGLEIKVNEANLLRGNELAGLDATLEIYTDKDANVAEIRGTESLTRALVSLATPEAQEAVAAMFSPERLKALFFQRVDERVRDLVGRPAVVGESWMSNAGAEGVVLTKQLRVEAQEPCGAASCLRIKRDYEIDKLGVWAMARERVAAWVQAQGGDPSELALKAAQAKLEDVLLVDPSTMEFHHATFDHKAAITVASAERMLQVEHQLRRESEYRY